MAGGFIFLARAVLPEAGGGFTALWFGVILLAVVVAVTLWRHLRDRTFLHYAVFVGSVGLMSLCNQVMEPWLVRQLGEKFDDLDNLMHVPYAVFYLLFVMQYFRVRENFPRWALFYRIMLWIYVAALAWLGYDTMVPSDEGSAWVIMFCNLVCLLSSLVLAAVAAHEHRPGAREFLYASVPLTVSGLVLVAQFAGVVMAAGPGLLAFRLGFILYVMIFLVALGVRYRGIWYSQTWEG
ncbi:MAG: 7TM diverse intracellular signaling domain-containing protein [Opitutales bacterium]